MQEGQQGESVIKVWVQASMHSEDAARRVVDQYQDCALDGQALKVKLAGQQASTKLKSGLGLVRMRNAPQSVGQQRGGGGGGGGGGAPRGRGSDRSGMRAY